MLTALPVFNEQEHVGDVLDQVRLYSSEILVVDDGSVDDTPNILSRQTDIHVVRHETNRGYGAGLRTAFEYAIAGQYDVLLTVDCDGQHQPQLIPRLAAAMEFHSSEPPDLVSGSRYLRRFVGDSRPPQERRHINRQVTRILNDRLGLNLTDAFCGFKGYRVDALRDLAVTEPGYALPLQLWVQAVSAGWKIVEFPVPLVYLEEKRSFGGALDDGRRRMAYYLEVFEGEIARTTRRQRASCLTT